MTSRDWLIDLVASGFFNRQRPVESEPVVVVPEIASDGGRRLCRACGVAEVVRPRIRCAPCYREYKRRYCHDRYVARKALANAS